MTAGLAVGRGIRPQPGLQLAEADLRWWADQVRARLGLHYPAARWGQLERGLGVRMGLFGLPSLEAYRDFVLTRPVEWRGLADELTVRETSFFRRPETFNALSETLLPELAAQRRRTGDLEIRVWSAGCSTGEEAYSLAIAVNEAIDRSPLWKVDVLGTDLSQRAIHGAKAGTYRASRLANVGVEQIDRYFEPAPAAETRTAELCLRVRAGLRNLVHFSVHNLTSPAWPSSSRDVILCQNVLMYLCPDQRATVLQRLFHSLATPGYLMVGPADLPAEPQFGGVRPFNLGGALVYRRS